MSTNIKELIWNGSVPCIITLSPNDSNQMTETYQFYISIPRNSYFPHHLKQALRYFKPHLLVPEWVDRPDWWLEFEGVPLRWNWPVGVLYDTMTGRDPEKQKKVEPWRLTLRYRNYPETRLLPLETESTLESHWVNQVKESCYVMNGTAKPMMVLSKNDSSDLWDSVVKHDSKAFWSIFKKISPKTPDSFKHIPVRFYITVADKVLDLPVRPLDSDEFPRSLGSVLHETLPDLFPSSKNYILAKPVLHGIVIPIETPLAELYSETHYVDGFMHFAIIPIA